MSYFSLFYTILHCVIIFCNTYISFKFQDTQCNKKINQITKIKIQGLVRVSSWEFKSPLRHHNKINGLQKKPLRFGGAFFVNCKRIVSGCGFRCSKAFGMSDLKNRFVASGIMSAEG
jgi:hypothetical protein